MSLTNSELTNEYSRAVAQIDPTTLTTWVPQEDNLLRKLFVENVVFGKRHITRNVSIPETTGRFSRQFVPSGTGMPKEVQGLDLVCVSDRRSIPAVDYAGDVGNVMNHVAALGDMAIEMLEILMLSGSPDPLAYGILDYPSGTAGTIIRPEQCALVTGLAWGTVANVRSNIIDAVGNMITKGFKPDMIVAPQIVKPMILEVMANTTTPIREWFTSTAGLPIYFSDYVHPTAAKADFNVAVLDSKRCGMAMTPLDMNSYYSNDQKAYAWDYETYATPVFNPLFDGTEWLKGVCMIDACSWT